MNLFEAIFGFRLVQDPDDDAHGRDFGVDVSAGVYHQHEADETIACDALSELGERVQSIVLQRGAPGSAGRWHLSWVDHDSSTGSLSHPSLVVAVVEALRRVTLAQEVEVNPSPAVAAPAVAALLASRESAP